MKIHVIRSIQNSIDGIEAILTRLTDGRLAVSVRDTDADMTLPESRIFPSHERGRANAYTEKCAGIPI